MKNVGRLRFMCFWLGWLFLLLAGEVVYETIHQMYFPPSFGLGYSVRLSAVLLTLFPLLLTFIPFGLWGILTALCEMHAQLERQTRLLERGNE